MTSTITRADVVLSHVQAAWLRTIEIAIELEQAGYGWSAQTVLDQLKYLASKGLVERRQIGRAYEWRTVPAPEPQAPAPDAVTPDAEAILDELRGVIERAQRPAVTPLDAVSVYIGDEAPLNTLLVANGDIVGRIIERSQYVAFREVANMLDGWLEVSRENHEGMHRDRFEDCCGRIAPSDVLDMLDAAAEALGVRKAPRKADDDATS